MCWWRFVGGGVTGRILGRVWCEVEVSLYCRDLTSTDYSLDISSLGYGPSPAI